MNHADFITYLNNRGACHPAMKWVRNNKFTSAQVWKNCPKLDWLSWLSVKAGNPFAREQANKNVFGEYFSCDHFRSRVKHRHLTRLKLEKYESR